MKVTGYRILVFVTALSVALIFLTERSPRPAEQKPSTFVGLSESLTGVVNVVDGDTIRLGSERVRLFGIDAPEKSQPCLIRDRTVRCGDLATNALRSLAEGKTASCQPQGGDRYGRTIAICIVGNEDIGAAMVKQGMAVAYAKYSYRYVPLEKEAQIANKGIWAGKFETPEGWRRSN